MNIAELGESINEAGRGFKSWFTDFTLVYSPIFIVLGLILTGVDLFLNLGIGTSLWFRVPWSIAQLFAVDGLWFAVWNRILTDEYRWKYAPYHIFLIVLGLCMTGIAITMNYIIFTQDYMGLRDSVAAMNFVGIPVGLFLLVRSVLLMATATLAIVLDKVMRTKRQYKANVLHKPTAKPYVPEPSTKIVPVNEPDVLLLPERSTKTGYREQIKSTIEKFNAEGRKFTNQDIADEVGCKLQTVKTYAPKIKRGIE